jgi:hypothetical protein
MCVQNLFKPPSITPPAPVEAKTPTAPDEYNSGQAVADARRKTRAAAALAEGRGSTILTGAQGLGSGASTAKKQTLGS